MIQAICLWVSWLTFIVISAKWDADRYKQKETIDHKKNMWIRVGVAVAFYVVLGEPRLFGWFVLGSTMSFWLIFNITYALLIGQRWDFVGTTSVLDRFESKWQPPVIFAKILLSFTAIYMYFYQL